MAEYIEFEATKQAIDRIRSVYHRARDFNAVSVIDNVFGEIKEIPAADVAPVVHAWWEMKPEDTTPGIYHVKKAFCTNCGKPNKQYRPPYCPNCGAKMDGGADNG